MEYTKRNISAAKKTKTRKYRKLLVRCCPAVAVIILAFFCCCWVLQYLASDLDMVLPEEVTRSEGFESNIQGKSGLSLPLYGVPVFLQKPELPTGCEATAAAMLLTAYGYDVDKETFAQAMPKSSFVIYGGRTYSAHPNDAYIGNPSSSYGYGAFARVTAQTMQDLIDSANGNHCAVDITGSSEKEILNYIDHGSPVCIWSTVDLLPVGESGSWYIKKGSIYTDEYFQWPRNEHCMVLVSYDEETVTVHDPLKGICSYSRDTFFQRYMDVGQYAVVLKPENKMSAE